MKTDVFNIFKKEGNKAAERVAELAVKNRRNATRSKAEKLYSSL